MTTMELEAQKAMLAREILNIDDLEMVKKLKAYIIRTKAKAKEKEEYSSPYTLKEINAWIDEAEAEEAAGIPGTPHEQVMQNMRNYIAGL